ncbi:HAD-IC family P-type ATPase [Weissella paramesenteroides]|uniref:HAD-IC family P-type ATPase n=1 Tax=Weissella paramesenteroides TaxID=1249 RepID=UPI0013D94E87|nr:HAD-IC family P-type ATPase [Weissella paramesenteroides]NEZ89055.1 HAD family hydrolase [Weissella paramesenteroides]NFB03380.1 HAD family hydrolase [Weissella paramesenteroides]
MEYSGLENDEVVQQQKKLGLNEVNIKKSSLVKSIVERLWEPTAWILEVALIIEVLLGKYIQAFFILIMLVFSAVNGAFQSNRARRALSSLSSKLNLQSSVKRSGTWQYISSKYLVIGDLISLETGNIIPADGELLTKKIEVDESSITGETTPVIKEQGSILYAGTTVIGGDTLAKVIATGKNSRSGKTISLTNNVHSQGKLQKLLGKVIGYLAILDTILAIILVLVSIFNGTNLIYLAPFVAMLFIATIPIAMPSSFSVANSIEANILSKQNILVSDLSGIQDSANLNLLLIDKTGTITNGNPTVVKFLNYSDYQDNFLLTLARLTTNFKQPSMIDKAIQQFSESIPDQGSLKGHDYRPFVSTNGYASIKVDVDAREFEIHLGSLKILNKGNALIDQNLLNQGRSVAISINNKFCGYFIIDDTPRQDSKTAIQSLLARGVRVVMLTGDNVHTAQNIANEVGMSGKVVSFSENMKVNNMTDIAGIADVLPENKLNIVQKFQKLGYVVGMTGDGINDSPALKQADVGIAVNNAVDLAKQSAKIVLMKDGLNPIVEILDSGHRVYQRMMTWTITKLSRTAELTLLLTIGYVFLKQVPLSLNALVLVAILNDIVTLVLGTDNTKITFHPEKWDVMKLCRIAFIYAFGWTMMGLLLMYLVNVQFIDGSMSTVLYVYLIFSAMLTILMTRTNKYWWQSKPSFSVVGAISLNCVLTILLSLFGIGVNKISASTILLTILIVLVTGSILNTMQVVIAKRED